MNRIVSAATGWVVRQAVLLLVILAVLLSLAWVNGELRRAGDLQQERARLAARKQVLSAEIDVMNGIVTNALSWDECTSLPIYRSIGIPTDHESCG